MSLFAEMMGFHDRQARNTERYSLRFTLWWASGDEGTESTDDMNSNLLPLNDCKRLGLLETVSKYDERGSPHSTYWRLTPLGREIHESINNGLRPPMFDD